MNVTGEPFLILDVDDWTKLPTASLKTAHGSVTSITKGYSTQNMEVEFLGDHNIFIHVDLKVSAFIERFSFECRKIKTKVITPANHNRRKQDNEPIKI